MLFTGISVGRARWISSELELDSSVWPIKPGKSSVDDFSAELKVLPPVLLLQQPILAYCSPSSAMASAPVSETVSQKQLQLQRLRWLQRPQHQLLRVMSWNRRGLWPQVPDKPALSVWRPVKRSNPDDYWSHEGHEYEVHRKMVTITEILVQNEEENGWFGKGLVRIKMIVSIQQEALHRYPVGGPCIGGRGMNCRFWKMAWQSTSHSLYFPHPVMPGVLIVALAQRGIV